MKNAGTAGDERDWRESDNIIHSLGKFKTYESLERRMAVRMDCNLCSRYEAADAAGWEKQKSAAPGKGLR